TDGRFVAALRRRHAHAGAFLAAVVEDDALDFRAPEIDADTHVATSQKSRANVDVALQREIAAAGLVHAAILLDQPTVPSPFCNRAVRAAYYGQGRDGEGVAKAPVDHPVDALAGPAHLLGPDLLHLPA